MPSSTKWRILVQNLQGGLGHSNAAIAEMEMHTSIGGADQCTGGTPTASSILGGGFEADKAFDDNAGTMWNTGTSPIGSWLEYEFASALDIVEYSIQARASFLNDSPVCWTLQYWDGGAWQGRHLVLGEPAWSGGETRTYTCRATKEEWWFQIDLVQGGVGHGNGAVVEMEMRLTPSGADECTGGTASAFANIGGGYEADKAFDDNATTMWNVGNPIGTSLKYVFASAKDIVEYTLQARVTAFVADTPVDWKFMYYDGVGFVAAHTVTGEPTWVGDEIRTYTFGGGAPPPGAPPAQMFVIT